MRFSSRQLPAMFAHCLLPAFATILSIGLCSRTAHADTQWSGFQSVGSGVSVSFAQVNRDTWTWKFRNDEDTTITYMDFKYTDSKGDHKDTLPGSLGPHKVFGGWAAFTASSRPTIEISKIKRK